jgi:hypothetical protein
MAGEFSRQGVPYSNFWEQNALGSSSRVAVIVQFQPKLASVGKILYIKFHENSFGGSQVVTMVAELFGQ